MDDWEALLRQAEARRNRANRVTLIVLIGAIVALVMAMLVPP